jgi:hypothetical protein
LEESPVDLATTFTDEPVCQAAMNTSGETEKIDIERFYRSASDKPLVDSPGLVDRFPKISLRLSDGSTRELIARIALAGGISKMSIHRRHYEAETKMRLLGLHFLDGLSVSQVCQQQLELDADPLSGTRP